jgi:hypothetical protein
VVRHAADVSARERLTLRFADDQLGVRAEKLAAVADKAAAAGKGARTGQEA